MNTKELIINRLQHLAVEKGLDMHNCKDIAEVYEKYFKQLKNTSSNSEYTSPSAKLNLKPKCKDGGRHHWKVGYECAKCGLHRETFINWGRA